MSLAYKENKWVVTYYRDGLATFERFDSKDEVMECVEQLREEYGFIMNDVTIYPPYADLQAKSIVTYGVPELFLKEMKP